MKVAWTIPALMMLALSGACPALAAPYDKAWHRSEFWSGEYPHGFTLAKDVTVKIRAELDPDAPRSIDCALKKGATYHPWNEKRTEDSKLEFVSYLRTQNYIVTKAVKIIAYDVKGDAELELSLDKGDEWTYRAYYAEGAFEMSFRGKTYSAEQDLLAASKEKTPAPADSGPDEWMKLTCANGTTGWLLLEDTREQPGFEAPEFPEYGVAVDRK